MDKMDLKSHQMILFRQMGRIKLFIIMAMFFEVDTFTPNKGVFLKSYHYIFILHNIHLRCALTFAGEDLNL